MRFWRSSPRAALPAKGVLRFWRSSLRIALSDVAPGPHCPELLLLNSCLDHGFVPPRESLRQSQDLGQANSKWKIHGCVTAEYFLAFG